MNRHEATVLSTRAAQALEAEGIEGVEVTTDPTTIANQLAAGGPGVLIMAPRIEYTTYHAATATWTVLVLAPQHDQIDAGWDTLTALLDVLREPLDVDSADPTAWQSHQGRQYPAYSLTLTTEHDA